MADKRLIDANALLKEIEDWHDSLGGTMNPVDWGVQNVLQSVMDSINEAEDIDAAPVVRCRECWRRQTVNCPMFLRGGDYACRDGFCHMGAKMDAKDMDVPTKDGGADND